jgi:hypothetical protein
MNDRDKIAKMLIGKLIEDADKGSDSKNNLAVEDQIEVLKKYAGDYHKKHIFKVGQVVKVKPSYAHTHKVPRVGQPVVIVELLEEHTRNKQQIGSPYYGEVEDCRIAVITDDGKPHTYVFESALLEPWDAKKK